MENKAVEKRIIRHKVESINYIKLGSLIFCPDSLSAIRVYGAEVTLVVDGRDHSYSSSSPEYNLILAWIRDALGFDV